MYMHVGKWIYQVHTRMYMVHTLQNMNTYAHGVYMCIPVLAVCTSMHDFILLYTCIYHVHTYTHIYDFYWYVPYIYVKVYTNNVPCDSERE
jgi:hypothetical protein